MTRPERLCWIAGAVGLLGSAAGWLLAPGTAPLGWVAALVAWLGLPLGSAALLLIHRLTGGQWGDALAPALRATIATLPLAVPVLLAIALALPAIYPWARGEAGAYLNAPFFSARMAACLVVWAGIVALALWGRGAWSAGPALAALAVTFTVASVDLSMSLDPHFHSSIWGMLAGCEAVLLALAVAAALRTDAVGPALEDIAKLLLALVLLWTYLDVMQLIIIWQSDLAVDAPWLAARMAGGWGVVMAAVMMLRFALPFAVLLSGRLRRRPGWVRGVAVMVVATQVLRTWWLVLPSAPRAPGWADGAAMLAVTGIAAALTLRGRDAHG